MPLGGWQMAFNMIVCLRDTGVTLLSSDLAAELTLSVGFFSTHMCYVQLLS